MRRGLNPWMTVLPATWLGGASPIIAAPGSSARDFLSAVWTHWGGILRPNTGTFTQTTSQQAMALGPPDMDATKETLLMAALMGMVRETENTDADVA